MRMSAFIVGITTINTIVTLLSDELRENPSFKHFFQEQARKYNVDIVSDDWKEKLTKAMHALNVSAVDQRYNEKNALDTIVYSPVPYGSRIAAFKSLQCWMYQCAEGDVPETDLYKFFEEVEKQIAISIVIGLLAYDKAKWG